MLFVEPNESGKGFEFSNKIVGGVIPKEYIPAVEDGIKGAMQSGVLAGYSVVDVKVTLLDGSYHEVDSSELAFKIAASMAFKEACRKAQPVLLEPIMKVTIIVPDEYMGDVMSDITARRGHITGTTSSAALSRSPATYLCLRFSDTPRNLRLRTQGRGQYVMEPSHYVRVPKALQEELVSSHDRHY